MCNKALMMQNVATYVLSMTVSDLTWFIANTCFNYVYSECKE